MKPFRLIVFFCRLYPGKLVSPINWRHVIMIQMGNVAFVAWALESILVSCCTINSIDGAGTTVVYPNGDPVEACGLGEFDVVIAGGKWWLEVDHKEASIVAPACFNFTQLSQLLWTCCMYCWTDLCLQRCSTCWLVACLRNLSTDIMVSVKKIVAYSLILK